MTTDLVVVNLETPFLKIKELFDENKFHHLPVVDPMNMIKGIISQYDFYKFAYQMSFETTGKTFTQKSYTHLYAKDIMTKYPVVLNPDDSLELAASLFLENIYHAIPIMEDGVLVGIVTSHDLLANALFNVPIGDER